MTFKSSGICVDGCWLLYILYYIKINLGCFFFLLVIMTCILITHQQASKHITQLMKELCPSCFCVQNNIEGKKTQSCHTYLGDGEGEEQEQERDSKRARLVFEGGNKMSEEEKAGTRSNSS